MTPHAPSRSGRDCQRGAWPAHKAACAAARKKTLELDWTIGDYAGSDLLTFARSSISHIENAHDLLQSFADFARVSFGAPAGTGFLGAELKTSVLANAPKALEHAIYFMTLGAIAYSFVFETLGGKARVYLSFLGSYSLGEWLRPQPPRIGEVPLQWAMARAHARWGGGRFLSLAELEEFCDALTELQAASEEASADLLERLPIPAVRRAQLLYNEKQPMAESPVSRWVGDVQYVDANHTCAPYKHAPQKNKP